MHYKIEIVDKCEYEKWGGAYNIIPRYANGEKINTFDEIAIFMNIKINDCPFFLEAITHYRGFLIGEYSRVSLSEFDIDNRKDNYDDEVKYIPANKVSLFQTDSQRLIDKVEFFKLCLQFAHKALEAMEVFHLKKKGIVDDKWENEIIELIPKIEEKVKEVVERYGDEENE